ncbi:hypothetical protein HT44_13340, partial [Listeria monocytogenes]
MWRLSMSWSGSGARALFPSEHKERKGVDKLITPKPSWHCRNLCFDLPTGEGAPERFGGGGLIEWGAGES